MYISLSLFCPVCTEWNKKQITFTDFSDEHSSSLISQTLLPFRLIQALTLSRLLSAMETTLFLGWWKVYQKIFLFSLCEPHTLRLWRKKLWKNLFALRKKKKFLIQSVHHISPAAVGSFASVQSDLFCHSYFHHSDVSRPHVISTQATTGRKGDEDILPFLTPRSRPVSSPAFKSRGRTSHSKFRPMSAPGVRTVSRQSQMSIEEEGDVSEQYYILVSWNIQFQTNISACLFIVYHYDYLFIFCDSSWLWLM